MADQNVANAEEAAKFASLEATIAHMKAVIQDNQNRLDELVHKGHRKAQVGLA